jgi:hypothetical protein
MDTADSFPRDKALRTGKETTYLHLTSGSHISTPHGRVLNKAQGKLHLFLAYFHSVENIKVGL